MERYTHERFHMALGKMLTERYGDALGIPNITPFLTAIAEDTGWSREYVRLQLKEQRPLQKEVVEAAAKALDIEPDYFIEYRQWQVFARMEQYPEITDALYETATALIKAQEQRSSK